MCLLLFGCNKTSSSKVISEYKKALKTDQYEVVGQMDIVSNEEIYHYDVKVDYMEGNYYKASLVNKDNNHEQIILKNESGVYVITPELNKSFKFQSEWPYNSSQAYILSSLLKDLENDSNVLVEERNDEYILTSSVNYPNNSSLISQKITFGKDYLPKQVEVFNKEGITNIKFIISKIDLKPKLVKEDFELEKILVVTYTEKAAGELRDRIRKACPDNDVDNAPIFTIHSFCQKTLSEFSFTANQCANLTLVEDTAIDDFIDRWIRDVLITDSQFKNLFESAEK